MHSSQPVPKAKPFSPEEPQPIAGFDEFGYLDLASVGNARDLGGMPTADGRRIKRGMLLRSGDLASLKQADLNTLVSEHNLAHVFDFRTDAEILHSPDPIVMLQGVSYTHQAALAEDDIMAGDASSLLTDIEVMHAFAHDALQFMREFYVRCFTQEKGIQAYSAFLQSLLAGTGATLWHCTQGKDRTGIAALLVEHILGVSPDDIMQDYLATNLYMQGWVERLEQFMRSLHITKTVDVEIEAFIYANRENMAAGLKAVQDQYGSLDNYIEKTLEFGADEQKALRALYLEEPAA